METNIATAKFDAHIRENVSAMPENERKLRNTGIACKKICTKAVDPAFKPT